MLEAPMGIGLTVLDPTIHTGRPAVQDPIKSFVRVAERKSSFKSSHPPIKNSCVWNVTRNRAYPTLLIQPLSKPSLPLSFQGSS